MADAEQDEEQPQSLFGKVEAAALLAVEDANGGELSELDQVLASYHFMFGQWPETSEFTEACGLLCEAGLVEWQGRALGLTPRGRKLLRRAGRPGASRRPKLVTDLLQGIKDSELADEGSVPEPSQDEVADVLKAMTENPYLADSFQSAPAVTYSFIGLSAYGAQVPRLNVPPITDVPESDEDDDEYEYDGADEDDESYDGDGEDESYGEDESEPGQDDGQHEG
jgi:hypothetical protein